jgi:NTP pyrophosphatase (non-canonical NTP hydrolase)
MSEQTTQSGRTGDNLNSLVSRFNNLPLNLEILAEEAAEVAQAKSKLIRFGLDHKHPTTGESAMRVLEQEVGDFLAIVDCLIEHGQFDSGRLEAAKKRKLEKMAHWYNG